ncbi:uncharacterized protein LOC135390673 [Ornithodoros turicata]
MADNTVCLSCGSDSAVVNLFGATVTSWKVDGKEALFLSEKARFDGETPIRGGIPIVFPHFGPWESGPLHGFAQMLQWTVREAPHESDNGGTTTALGLMHSPTTRDMWDYRFEALYRVTLKKSELVLDLEVTNQDDAPFDFTTLLHTYFLLSNVRDCLISGCKGCSYIDKVRNSTDCQELREFVSVSGPIDNVYKKTDMSHTLKNAAGGRTILVTKQNLPDTVVWNPWAEGIKLFEDLDHEDYNRYICVEAGYVAEPVRLSPNSAFKASCSLKVTS